MKSIHLRRLISNPKLLFAIFIILFSAQLSFGQRMITSYTPKDSLSSLESMIVDINNELWTAKVNSNSGIAITCLGAGVYFGNKYFINNDSNLSEGATMGINISAYIFMIAGTLITLESFTHVGKAQLMINNYGIGMGIPIKSK